MTMTHDEVQNAVIDSLHGTRGTDVGTLARVIDVAWILVGSLPFETPEKLAALSDLLAKSSSTRANAMPGLVHALLSCEIYEALEPFFVQPETGE